MKILMTPIKAKPLAWLSQCPLKLEKTIDIIYVSFQELCTFCPDGRQMIFYHLTSLNTYLTKILKQSGCFKMAMNWKFSTQNPKLLL